MENNAYVSCIKIKGVPILPPLITPNIRQELLDLKNRAVQLEKEYVNRREKSEKHTNKKECSVSNTMDEAISDELLPSTDSSSLQKILKDLAAPSKYVSYETVQKESINSSKSVDSNPEVITSLSSPNNLSFRNEHGLSTIQVELNLDKSFDFTDQESEIKSDIFSASTEIILDNNSSESESENTLLEKPMLIRSNSYTLDNPSPLLLAHLQKLSSVPLNDDSTTPVHNDETESELTDGHYIPSKPISKKVDVSTIETKDTQMNLGNEVNEENVDNMKPSFEVITTDITVQQINITTPINCSRKDKNLNKLLSSQVDTVGRNDKEESANIDSEEELKSILQQIPENYSKKILQLIERQKAEQLKRFQNYENLKNGLLDFGDFQNNNNNLAVKTPNTIFVTGFTPNAKTDTVPMETKPNMEKMRSKSISESFNLNQCHSPRPRTSSAAESQSLHYDMSTSCSESLDEDILSTDKMLDVDSEYCIDYLSVYEKMYPMISRRSDSKSDGDKSSRLTGPTTVTDKKTLKKIAQQKAAVVICAYAKGYLVRRLMRTAKVQTLIQTIQDALLCALELQKSDNIEEPDVELHRRLIQQVSAACYEFHDVFFGLTTPEQMDLISIDREKKKKSFSIKSSQSFVDFNSRKRQNHNVRLTKSLTKV